MKRGTKNGLIKEMVVATRFGDFLCIFESNAPDKGYTVTSPALRGFVTYGNSFAHAKRSAKEGIEFHLECVLLECKVPAPRSFQVLSK